MNKLLPEYPRQAVRYGIEGSVKVQFNVDTFGAVFDPITGCHLNIELKELLYVWNQAASYNVRRDSLEEFSWMFSL